MYVYRGYDGEILPPDEEMCEELLGVTFRARSWTDEECRRGSYVLSLEEDALGSLPSEIRDDCFTSNHHNSHPLCRDV